MYLKSKSEGGLLNHLGGDFEGIFFQHCFKSAITKKWGYEDPKIVLVRQVKLS